MHVNCSTFAFTDSFLIVQRCLIQHQILQLCRESPLRPPPLVWVGWVPRGPHAPRASLVVVVGLALAPLFLPPRPLVHAAVPVGRRCAEGARRLPSCGGSGPRLALAR